MPSTTASPASTSPSVTKAISATGRDTELRLYDYLAAVTARGWVIVAMTSTFRRTKRFIKQTPILWNVFSKLRARKAPGSVRADAVFPTQLLRRVARRSDGQRAQAVV